MREPSAGVAGNAPVPSTGPGQASRYANVWMVWASMAVALVVVDVTFNLWFWRVPKMTVRGDWGYRFQIDLRRLHAPKPADTLRVVAFGSSVAGAFDPYQVQSLLDAVAPGVEVHRLMKPGLKAADYRLLFEVDGAALQPDIAVFAFNVVDFLNPSDARGLREGVRDALPPWVLLTRRFHATPTLDEKLDLAVASVSNLYRHRKEIDAALRGHRRAFLQWLRTRPGHGPYGVYPDGYAAQHFGVSVGEGGPASLEYFVDPHWIRQRGQVRLTFSLGGVPVAERLETTPGWKTVSVDVPKGEAAILDVTADSAWNPRAAGSMTDTRLLGVRLRDATSAAPVSDGRRPFRYPPFQQGQLEPFLRMGTKVGESFAAHWQQVVDAPTAFGRHLRLSRDSKLRLRHETFAPDGEYAEVQQLVAWLAERGVTVILVNTPESPWLLQQYEDTPYYRAYLQFFEGLATQHANVRFFDLRKALAPEDFNDWIHPNFVGAIKLGPRYADMLKSARPDRRAQSVPGV